MSRTKVDFSKHVLTETKSEKCLIHKFANPTTSCYSITFINSCGVLAVTGDCGNWIFCREFHPSAEGGVSDSYWCEKIRISSKQDPYEYDEKKTKEEIEERLNEEDISEAEKEYLNEILGYVDEGEFWYQARAHEDLPDCYDHEDVPFCKRVNPMLEVVFDAFDEICNRMKNKG